MTQEASYPKRKRFDAHRICRLLHKTCAAQEIGPLGALLVTVIAHQEDSCRYRRPVTFYDGQLMPILGVTSQETLTTARRKAVNAGWLVYQPGHKGRASTYFASIPPHVSGLEDGTIDEGTDSDSSDLRSEKSTESRSNPDRKGIESRSNPDGKVPPFFPYPNPIPKEISPPACASDGTEIVDSIRVPEDPHFNWPVIIAEFLATWNASPATSHVTRLPFLIESQFRECWSDPDWREKVPRAIERLGTSATWHGQKLSIRTFVDPLFPGELLDGVHDQRKRSRPTRVAAPKSEPSDPTPNAPPPTVLERVTVPLLQKTADLVSWFHDAAAIGITDGTENSRHNVVAAACRALMPDVRDPVAWFVSTVTGGEWDRIGEEADEVARKRLKTFDAKSRGKVAPSAIGDTLAQMLVAKPAAELTERELAIHGDGEIDQ